LAQATSVDVVKDVMGYGILTCGISCTYWCTSVFTSSSLRTSCRWSVRSRQSLHVPICARQVKVTWLCRGPEQLASVHEAFQSLVR